MSNLTFKSEFLLLEFSEVRELQILHFLVFLVLYLATMTGNLLIILAIAFDHHLHTPMYFFLMNLAILDISSVSVIIPKSMANSITSSRSISYSGCVAQVFFYFLFASTDFAILTVMARDRYVAICNPLQYERIMHKRACVQMACSAWITCFLYAAMHTGSTFSMSFCSKVVNQFFCEIPSLLNISCSDLYLVEVGLLVFGCSLSLGCFIFIFVTYVHIFSAVLKIPSVHGQRKALSTCIPHLTVVCLFESTAVLAYTRSPTNSSSGQDLVIAIIYSMVPPLMNPVVYSMRNKNIKVALWKLLAIRHTSDSISRIVL
ncbi:PREDICTED: olfactory receptor 14I1-like [Gekko japonicus]|uniref:Olfactory receptor 14I1-like n=1 Tax=Gekko japonicus TaxID=146911 RepID=A0ABM1KNR9_GEKJA|nr:PREDICTED: olfactory receptor 14I1-like [Gekko japonicus]